MICKNCGHKIFKITGILSDLFGEYRHLIKYENVENRKLGMSKINKKCWCGCNKPEPEVD